ncbi:undecaprenyl/decaprenyl-phosphate alpha-N-acetylglucosaminyl 1-phosphate transferase [Patescibacteria group bacterium]|nr:undecaprenyl/decaprenyl-phosphate alpha-N-acetylglucosaminyl 1-phosphate transferase [Patescibacteria group bacterium]
MSNLIPISWPTYLWPFSVALILGYLLTLAIKLYAEKRNWFAYYTSHQTHRRKMVRLGGVAIYLAFIIPLLIFMDLTPQLTGLLISVSLMFLMGLLDDIYNLKAWLKILIQLLAIGTALAFGIRIDQITNPFGGVIILSPIWNLGLTAVWLWLVTNAVNLLDGLDGLAAGATSIAAGALFYLSLFAFVNQPQTAVLAIILLGTSLGFLRWNWFPAKIFMGDSGSYTLGFLVGALAIIGGAKLATASLVLGFPLLDAVYAIIRRLLHGKNPFSADRDHLHHRLLAVGVPHMGVTLIILGISAVFGIVSLLSGTWAKLIALAVTLVVMILLIRTIFLVQRRKGSLPR